MRNLVFACLVFAACDNQATPAPTLEPNQSAAAPKPDAEKPSASRSASRAAVRLAEYKAKEHGVEAGVVPLGQPLRIYDFDIQLEQPIVAEPETRLPWIANVEERATFRGKKALIVPIQARNDAPVARELRLGFVLHTKDGKSHTGGVYNERLAAKQLGRVAWFDLEKQAPDAWVDTVLVFDVDPAHVDGAMLYAARWITVRDVRGRKRSVVEQHVVADLAAPVEGKPLRGGP